VVLAEQPHFPPLHACPVAHAVPHAPQFAASVFKLRQSLPHSTLPVAHVALPLPPTPLVPLAPPALLGALPPLPLPLVPALAGADCVPAAPPVACDGPAELAQPKIAPLSTLAMSAARQKERERLSMSLTPGYEFRSVVNLLRATYRSSPRPQKTSLKHIIHKPDSLHAARREHSSRP
jgi:hypothetical protein